MSSSDTEDESLDAENAKVIEEVTNKKKSRRAVWPRIIRHSKLGGKQIVSHPFLLDDNEIDKVVVRHLIVDEPFCSSHGVVSQAWKNCADNINKEIDSSVYLFPSITFKTLKFRFDAYMKFAVSKKAAVPFNSGCDDEAEPGEIQQGIEEMHEKYSAFMDTKENDKQSALSNKKGEQLAAEIIRRASLGIKPSDDELDECPVKLRGGYDKKKRASGGSSSSSMRSSDTGVGSLQDAMEQRNELMLMKEENKKRKLDIPGPGRKEA